MKSRHVLPGFRIAVVGSGAARRLGFAIPADFADPQLKRTAEMGAYRPSSLRDYLAGRPVELEAV